MTAEQGTHTVLAGGDIMPGGALGEWLRAEGVERKRDELARLFAGADLVTANLECPLTPRVERRRGQLWNLRSDPALTPLLTPFDVLALANNHILDFGAAALADTTAALAGAGIGFCGAGQNDAEAARPAIRQADNFTFGVLAFTDANWYPAGPETAGACSWQADRAQAAIAGLAQQVDFTVVHLHRGYEFLDYPGPEEITAARQAVDAGANLVLCHHSHTVMGVRRYGHAAVAYGLGNLLFDAIHRQHWETVRRRALVRFTVSRHRVDGWDFIPLLSDERGWPVVPPPAERAELLAHLHAASQVLEDEGETVQRFRAQAASVMLPHALGSLARLLRQEGPGAVWRRLRRVRAVDVSVLLARALGRGRAPLAGRRAE